MLANYETTHAKNEHSRDENVEMDVVKLTKKELELSHLKAFKDSTNI